MRKQVLVAMTVLTLGVGSTAQADGDGQPAPRRRLREELGLSEPQAAELARLRGEGRKATIRRRAEIAVARQELRELLTAPALDDKAVSAKVKQLSALQAAAVQARADGLIAMRRVLTPEQIEKLGQLPPHRPRRHPRRPRPDALTGPEGE
jgi:Spy/CpxP family protein refolding chaperone